MVSPVWLVESGKMSDRITALNMYIAAQKYDDMLEALAEEECATVERHWFAAYGELSSLYDTGGSWDKRTWYASYGDDKKGWGSWDKRTWYASYGDDNDNKGWGSWDKRTWYASYGDDNDNKGWGSWGKRSGRRGGWWQRGGW